MPVNTGFVIAGAGANINTGNQSWANPSRITADDGSRSIVSTEGSTSDTLKASNFGFSIPENATIVGIETRVQLRREAGNGGTFRYVNVGKSDAVLGTSKNPNEAIGTSDQNFDDGGAADLWGLSWTPAEINASTFQVRARIEGQFFGAPDIGCDAIWCRVFYLPALSADAGSFSLTGIDANLKTGGLIQADVGIFSLLGQSAEFIYDAGFFIAAGAGSFLVAVETEVVLALKRAIARVIETTYNVRPKLTKLRRSGPRLEE